MINRGEWRKQWLDRIFELTAIEFQKKTWLDKTGNLSPHFSFVEFMCSYFDDLISGNTYEYFIQQNLISFIELSVIKEWHEKLQKYKAPNNDDYNVEAILSDREWNGIMKIGEEARNELIKILSLSEANYLKEKEGLH